MNFDTKLACSACIALSAYLTTRFPRSAANPPQPFPLSYSFRLARLKRPNPASPPQVALGARVRFHPLQTVCLCVHLMLVRDLFIPRYVARVNTVVVCVSFGMIGCTDTVHHVQALRIECLHEAIVAAGEGQPGAWHYPQTNLVKWSLHLLLSGSSAARQPYA